MHLTRNEIANNSTILCLWLRELGSVSPTYTARAASHIPPPYIVINVTSLILFRPISMSTVNVAPESSYTHDSIIVMTTRIFSMELEAEIRQTVDELMREELKNLKMVR